MEQIYHLSEDQLEQYVQGRLASSETVRIEEHLMMCAVCQEKLEDTEDATLGMREALMSQSEPAAARAETAGWLAGLLNVLRRPGFSMALGFAALILVIAMFSNRGTTFVPSASLVLTAVRGEMPETEPAREFQLTLTDTPTEGGPFRVEVVNALGTSVWSGLAVSSAAGIRVTEPRRLDVGDYFVRLYSPDGKVLREYGFRVKR